MAVLFDMLRCQKQFLIRQNLFRLLRLRGRLCHLRDALFNNTLLLAYYKFNQMDKPLPEDDMDERQDRWII